jgi:hypothetical protein
MINISRLSLNNPSLLYGDQSMNTFDDPNTEIRVPKKFYWGY